MLKFKKSCVVMAGRTPLGADGSITFFNTATKTKI